MKRKFLLFVSLFAACVGMQAQSVKFQTSVIDKDGKGVVNTVYDDFSFEIKAPAKGATVNTKSAVVKFVMNEVPELGITGSHIATKTFNTGVDVDAILSKKLSSIYESKSYTSPVTIADVEAFAYPLTTSMAKSELTYKVTGDGNGTIKGVPTSTEDAKLAFKHLADKEHMTASAGAGDTYIAIKKGAYISFGDEKVDYTSDLDFCKGSVELTRAQMVSYFGSTAIAASGKTGDKTYISEFYFPAGSGLILGTKQIILEKDMTIYVDASKAYDVDELKSVITDYRKELDKSDSNVLLATMELLNKVLGYALSAGNVPVVVEFKGTPATDKIEYYQGSSILSTTKAKWNTLLAANPNLVAVADKTWAETKTNVMYKDGAGKYICPNFVLTDCSLSEGKNTDFYAPDFKAEKFAYARKTNKEINASCKYNSVCLPIELKADMLPAGTTIFAVKSYASTATDCTVNLESTLGVGAGVPCYVKDETNSKWEINLTNVDVKGTPNNLTTKYMAGTFVQKAVDLSDKWYALTGTENKLGILVGDLYPLRACFKQSGSFAKDFNVVFVDETSAISAATAENDAVENIYSVNGSQQKSLKKGVNIVKMQNGSVRKVMVK